MTPHLQLRWLQWGFLALGLLLLASWSRQDLESRGFQSAASARLDAALPETGPRWSEVASSGAPFVASPVLDTTRRTPEPGGALGRIEIPRLGIRAIVAEGTDARTLGRAVGHVSSTALPGSPGNCALAGHRDTFLRGLGRVRVNDLIHVVTREGTLVYRVEWGVVVEPQRVDVLDSTATRSLTLVTCYPFAFVGHAPQRFVVRARQVDTVARFAAIRTRGPSRSQGTTAEAR